MPEQSKIGMSSNLIGIKRLFVSYLFYFFLLQPVIGFFYPEWSSPQVFQLVEEEDSGQSRILEERVCHSLEDNFLDFSFEQIQLNHKHLYFYYISLYQAFKKETPSPPPEFVV